MFPEVIDEKARSLLERCKSERLRVATAESCTGGLVSACLTAIAGSSDVLDRAFVTYSNEAKQEMLGVPPALLEQHGAVSEEVARAMAEGALSRSGADLTVAITGIAGPGGATSTKPVGLVYVATAKRGEETLCERHVFAGDRQTVRLSSVERALSMLLERAGTQL
jgi:nicotinamide-nucleotide amidase